MEPHKAAATLERRWLGRLGRCQPRCVVGILFSDEHLAHRHVYARELGSVFTALGARPVMVFPARGPGPYQVDQVDALLIPGGHDLDPELYGGSDLSAPQGTPDREFDEFEVSCVRRAYDLFLPMLGVCRGHEVMNVAGGGNLVGDITEQVPGALKHCPTVMVRRRDLRRNSVHKIKIAAGSRLEQILRSRRAVVNSLHHQCIGEVSPMLRVTAWAPDQVPEAVERVGAPWQMGVQFHPEWQKLGDVSFNAFFEALVHDGSLYAAVSRRARP